MFCAYFELFISDPISANYSQIHHEPMLVSAYNNQGDKSKHNEWNGLYLPIVFFRQVRYLMRTAFYEISITFREKQSQCDITLAYPLIFKVL